MGALAQLKLCATDALARQGPSPPVSLHLCSEAWILPTMPYKVFVKKPEKKKEEYIVYQLGFNQKRTMRRDIWIQIYIYTYIWVFVWVYLLQGWLSKPKSTRKCSGWKDPGHPTEKNYRSSCGLSSLHFKKDLFKNVILHLSRPNQHNLQPSLEGAGKVTEKNYWRSQSKRHRRTEPRDLTTGLLSTLWPQDPAQLPLVFWISY